jgi:glutamine amidotransferase
MIAIVNHGLGNLRSVQYALGRLGEKSILTSSGARIRSAKAAILPGVGAFGQAMANLHRLGLVSVLRDLAESGRPLLGICLGVQLLFDSSREHGPHRGLGIIPGKVVRFGRDLTVPHMGWNQLEPGRPSPLLEGCRRGEFFYFAHSYFVRPADEGAVVGWTDYGGKFASAVQQGNVFGVQFHPEKSGPAGMRMLENFCALAGG